MLQYVIAFLQLLIENWVVWAEIMKTKGEFETAKEMYQKAIEMNDEDTYSKEELAKLEIFTQAAISSEIDEILVDLAERRAELNPKARDGTCGIL